MKTLRFALAGLLALLAVSASAQQFPVVPGHSVVGRLGTLGQSGPSQAIPFDVLKAQLLVAAISVKDYGATGNGTTDDTAAIQTASDKACGTVGIGGAASKLYFPAGFYKISSAISITCGLSVFGDGWSADSGALIQNTIISSNVNLSGSIIEPTSTSAGLVFSSNQAVQIRDIAVVYLSRPAALSGISGITIKASTVTSPPAALPWNVGSHIDHVWLYGADRNLILQNLGSFNVANSLFQMHASTGIFVLGPSLPYGGDWSIGPGNTFNSGSVTTCQHILITSGGGGRIQGNKFNTCGSNNTVPPLTTTGVQWSPDLNVANNSLEPIVVAGNTIEGLTRCLWFYGGNVGQNATATQIVVTGNQMWCLENILTTPTSTNAQWVSGMTIAGNFMNSQTVAGTTTTTSNLDLDGVNNVNVVGNTFGLVAGAGGDTSTAINIGAHAADIYQFGNWTFAGATMPTTVPYSLNLPANSMLSNWTGSAATALANTIPSCPNSGNNHLNYVSGTGVICGTASALIIGTTPITSGTTLRVLYDNAGVLGEYTNTQLTALINLATASLSGALPAWPNNTTTFFRGDGTYQTLNASALNGLGTGVATALNINVGTAGSVVVNGGALGTPSSGTGTNLTGIPTTGLTGVLQAAQEPAHTGDCTNTASSLALTCTQSAADFKVTGILQTGGDSRVSTQFDKTTDTTLANVTGLTATVTSGLTYGFVATLYTTANSASGVKGAIAGTATATAVTVTTIITSSGGLAGYGRTTSLGTATTGATSSTDATIELMGTITVNVGGTLTAQFAQNVSGGTASSVLVGSTMRVWKIQ